MVDILTYITENGNARIQLASANLQHFFVKALSWCWEIEFFPWSCVDFMQISHKSLRYARDSPKNEPMKWEITTYWCSSTPAVVNPSASTVAPLVATPVRPQAVHRSSRAREFHPHPLTEPCVKVSPHTALHTQRFAHRHNLSQMVLLLSSYPPLCLRVV